MSDSHWQRVQAIFDDAVLRPPQERADFLESACGDDPGVKAEVESLLRHDEGAPMDFLRPPEATLSSQPDDAADPLVGQRIGRYEIKSIIASGGMGTVYEAEQEQPKRPVALKIMKTAIPSRSSKRRFEYESEILARLLHPNIAQVYEAGTHRTDTGIDLPFFAMEFVPDAQTIDEYCDEQELSTRGKLELFTQVCEAVHHGHQKGIIHRDLKPANILIDSYGQVKIIDFGVARATDSDVAITTMLTDVGQLIGTLQYMSPEQCEADPLGLDIRSDVYSLGVVLYELLTRQPPYDVGRRPIPSAIRVICEEAPTRPSSIDRKLGGDLEVIVLKALDKDRESRYQSAAELALDIHRFLHHEPIAAKPPSVWTSIVHWTVRHPLAVTAGVSVSVAILVMVSTIIAVWLLNFEPYRIELADNRGEARLLSVSNRVLHTWSSAEDGLRTAVLIKQPEDLGEKRLAILGFAPNHPDEFRCTLCVFDTAHDLDDPIWQGIIKNSDLPSILAYDRGYIGADFHVTHCEAFDIFEEHAGKELVVTHQHQDSTQTALRIYDLAGKLLYQIWIDVDVQAVYWMPSAKQLVIAGLNGAAYWKNRGYPDVDFPHPSVVFAVQPKLDFVSKKYLSEAPGEDQLSPVWNQCLWPPKASDYRASDLHLGESYGKQDRGRFVKLSFAVDRETGAGLTWLIDERGREVAGSRRTGDMFKLHRDSLPDPNWFELHDLPPILSRPKSAFKKPFSEPRP